MTTITAALLTADDPRPVQVIVSDVAAGLDYQVEGVAPSGERWTVPGGFGESDGGQVLLVDTRTPVNVPVHYEVLVGEAYTASNNVTVPWAPTGAEPHYLLQSLDGQTVIPIRSWQDNALPRQLGLRTSVFDVRDRARPVVVLGSAGDGVMGVSYLLDRSSGDLMRRVMADGGALVVRTNGDCRDLPASDIAVITESSSVLWGGDNGLSDARVWSQTWAWIDDPEPSSIPALWTVAEVDELLGVTLGLTVADVDAMFAGQTVEQVDATDWGALAP